MRLLRINMSTKKIKVSAPSNAARNAKLVPTVEQKAIAIAVSALYYTDSADFAPALHQIIRTLGVNNLEVDTDGIPTETAYNKYVEPHEMS